MAEKTSYAKTARTEDELPPEARSFLLGDEPELYRLIKRRIGAQLKTKKPNFLADFYPRFIESDSGLPDSVVAFLAEEVALQNIGFLTSHEKLRKPVFEKIMSKIAHLDFRSFSDSQNNDFSLYDPEVITPQVSWVIEQIFGNLPGFFNALRDLGNTDKTIDTAQTDIIRNVFILGYLHGFLSQSNKELSAVKEYLAYFIRKSDTFADKLKPYPDFLRKLAEVDSHTESSPRLIQLKKHWPEQFARRWAMLVRTDEASGRTLSPTTAKEAERTLPPDRRPTDNLGAAKRMDDYTDPKSAGPVTYVAQQHRAEWANMTANISLQNSAIAHMRAVLQLYRGGEPEAFHNGQQVSEKWLPYKIAAEQILQKLVHGFSALNQAKTDNAFNDAATAIITDMMQSLRSASGDTPFDMLYLFGTNFFWLSQIERLSLLSFTALTFIKRENGTTKRAVQILDRVIVPRLDRYFDLDQSKKLFADTTAKLNFGEFATSAFDTKSKRAKLVLNQLTPSDGLVGIDSDTFTTLLTSKKQLLSGISKLYAFFAKGVGENWLDSAAPKTGILLVLFILTGLVSGYINFNLSQELLGSSLKTLFTENQLLVGLKLFQALSPGISGALLLGQMARRDFKKVSLSSTKLPQEIKKFATSSGRELALVVSLVFYASASMYPLWEKPAETMWDNFQTLLEKLENKDTEENDSSSATESKFWDNRNPEAQNPEALKKIEKKTWGEIIIGEAVFGQAKNEPIGFINTFITYPTTMKDGIQQMESYPVEYEQNNVIVINATGASEVENDRIIFTLSNGDKFTQMAAGTDFVVKNGLVNTGHGFAKFLDTDRVIDKIILIPKKNSSPGFPQSTLPFTYQSPSQYAAYMGQNYDYYVVYKTSKEQPLVGESVVYTAENKDIWNAYAAERMIILETLEKESPEAASLYNQMIIDHEAYWASAALGEANGNDYVQMMRRQVASYNNFVQTNHVYSLKYAPKTRYAEQYPNMGVMLDVMSLKEGGYYCVTAYLAAQQWFLSLGMPMDGLYGFYIYNDSGTAAARVGHVMSGLYGQVYDFTPGTPNPGEDLSSLRFNPEAPVDTQPADETTILDKESQVAIELLQKMATAENMALAILFLSIIAAGYSVKIGIKLLLDKLKNGTTQDLEQIKKTLPDNEEEMRALAQSLLQLFNLLAGTSESTPPELLSQIVRETLILSSSPAKNQNSTVAIAHTNPAVFSLLKLTGLSDEPLTPTDSIAAAKLWQKLCTDPKQTAKTLEAVTTLLKPQATDFQKNSEIQMRITGEQVRKLQKQLFRIRKKERGLYGRYGALLEQSKLVSAEKLADSRINATRDLFAVRHELEKKQTELQLLQSHLKLLPKNMQNLKRILNFIHTQVLENITHA